VDERADVYAAGLLAWRLGTGRAPFQQARNEDLELLRAMRYPRIKPLGALRPDLPERLCLAVAAALAPEAQHRTIRAEELASEVRASIDVDRGRAELGELLHLWRGPLERPHAGGSSSTDSSGSHKHATMNYEQVAALDDEPEADGPTVETHALPGDEVMWKALALNGSLDFSRAFMSEARPAPPRDPAHARPSDPERTAPTVRPTERVQTRAGWRLQLLLLALLAMVVGGGFTWLAHKALRAWGASVSSQSGRE
jgi:hypothetical protein